MDLGLFEPQTIVRGYTSSAVTTTASTEMIAAKGASNRIYITALLVTNSHATVGTLVNILSGSTVIWSGYAAPAGGGYAISFPIPLRCGANEAVNLQCGTNGSNVYGSVNGFWRRDAA